MPRQIRSVTLIELLIAISLLGILVLAFTSIDLFSRYHVITADFRTQLQNKASTLLEHMSKYISQGIGNVSNPAAIKHTTQEWIKVRLDRNSNGQPDDNDTDDWIAYRYIPDQYQIVYHATYPFIGWPVSGGEVISDKVSGFTCNVRDNYVNVTIRVCYDPDGTPIACGTNDNPEIEMQTNIKMPAVSTH